MQHPPSVTEAQEAISQQWGRITGKPLPTPHVLHTLLFFSQEEGLEAFAVVDPGGRECFTVAGWDMETINWEAELARGSKDRPVGCQINIGGIKQILISINGRPLPLDHDGETPHDYHGWLNAFSLQGERTKCWMRTRQECDGIRERLLARRQILQSELHKTCVFAELAHHHSLVTERLQSQVLLENILQELLHFCSNVGEPTTVTDLNHATTASQSLRQQIEEYIEEDVRVLQSLAEDHNRLQTEIWKQTAFGPTGQGSLRLEVISKTISLDL